MKQSNPSTFFSVLVSTLLYFGALFSVGSVHTEQSEPIKTSISKEALPADEPPKVPKRKVVEVAKPKRRRRRDGNWYTKMPWE